VTSPFEGPGPRWFSIPAHRPFLADLAGGLLKALPDEALADALVLLPSRRGARALAEAFVQAAGGRALLLPQIRALGDLDEGEPPFEPGDVALDLPAAVSPLRRRFELARLVSAHEPALGRSLDASGALELADALAAFLDSVELEELDEAGRLARVGGLVEGDLARHWRISVEFLSIVLEAWPERLAELGLIDPAARRVRLLRALAGKWRARPPEGPLLAAGSTGTAPANADLLALIAGLPTGAVALPGLDLELADDAWAEVGEQHPQGAMKRLLERSCAERGRVRPWPASAGGSEGRWRRRIVNEALRPADATADWVGQIRKLRDEAAGEGVDPISEGLKGLSVIAAAAEEEAAAAAALLLRETLETPGKTAALITPDQALARRVSARLARWGVEADSSGGAPLANAPVGVLAALAARAAVDSSDPIVLLAILKHPLTRLGEDPEEFVRARDVLERYGLRGARGSGADWIEQRLEAAALPRESEAAAPDARLQALSLARALLRRLRAALSRACEPYIGPKAAPAEAARGLVLAMEALAADATGDPGALWSGPDGEAASALLAGLIDESEGLPQVRPSDFLRLIERLLDGEVVRAVRAAHPRLKILGGIESRLVSADRLVLAGLEEGVWPQGALLDPFLSRPMRAGLGLPPPERRIGLAAHDFAQAACAPEVVLIHSQRRDGAPAVESRWLWRLRTLARGAGQELPSRPEVLAWARAVDEPRRFSPAPRPRPRPPVEARPAELPVTGVETWLRDPYAIYARYVLKLRQMERPDEPVEARARGVAVHQALQRFAEHHPGEIPERAEQLIEHLLVEALEEAGMPAPAMARERVLAGQAAAWLADFERDRRGGAQLLVEQKGIMDIPLAPDGRTFRLTARADRLEVRGDRIDVLDFKTGAAPSRKQMQSGFAPQLTLTAAILQDGGFKAAGAALPGELVYVRVTGGRKPGEALVRAIGGESQDWAEQALEGLKRRIARFSSPDTEYLSWAAPQFMHARGGDYDHLARVWEWHVIGDGEEGGE
jgi:ATP-dependent helicase/nuclease subunit B